jgi:hypothetical protein
MIKKLLLEMEENSGADRQIRTADLTLTKGALYQLSHISIWSGQRESNPHHQLGRLR